ncbi:MAG: hypothetical protein NW224_30815 [Leptolyngbyaceae cyanobacterium bins.302]|nr:hypothetical protein [Leptolyngbyaceae cyanobacterium bins.302]
MIYLYDVKTKDNSFGVVSLLSPEEAVSQGLPSKAIIGTVPENSTTINQNHFKANQEFVDFLHEIISRYAPMLPTLQLEAKQQGDGWVYVIDARVADAQGQVDPEEIIGAFQVKAGKIVTGKYQANANYRLVSKQGVLQIDSYLQEKLLEELRLL